VERRWASPVGHHGVANVSRATFLPMPCPLILNALVGFRTRLADDGLVHVRGWTTPEGPVVLVAELDWAILVADPADAYDGPGVFTYPGYALGAALDAAAGAGLANPRVVVRMPDPPGERFALVTDVEDPVAWAELDAPGLLRAMAGADPTGPPPGAYVRRVVEEWIPGHRPEA